MKIRIILTVALTAALTLFGTPTASAETSWLSGHIQNYGWTDARPSASVQDAFTVGTTGQSLRLEALRLNDTTELPFDLVAGHIQNIGWADSYRDSKGRPVVGTTGRSLRLEAVILEPHWSNSPFHIECQAHVQNIGWMKPVTDGEVCGTTGLGLRAEAFRIRIVYND